MRLLTYAIAALAGWLPMQAYSQTQQATPTLNCKTGPVDKTYGGTKWLVYSCDDNRTVVIVAAPDSSPSSFYFMFSPQQGRYQFSGEGTGNRQATDAAYQELRILPEGEVGALIAQTKQRPTSK